MKALDFIAGIVWPERMTREELLAWGRLGEQQILQLQEENKQAWEQIASYSAELRELDAAALVLAQRDSLVMEYSRRAQDLTRELEEAYDALARAHEQIAELRNPPRDKRGRFRKAVTGGQDENCADPV